MSVNANFNLAATTIMNFVEWEVWRQNVFQDLTISLCVKFGANLFNIVGVIATWLIAKWRQQPCAILAEVNFDNKSCSGAHFRRLFQIWCKYIQQWPSYGHKCDLQSSSCRHLGFYAKLILSQKPVPGPYSQCLYQIWCESVQKLRSYCHLTDLKLAAAAILDFCTMWIKKGNLAAGHHFQPLYQIQCKYVQ